MVIVWLIWKWLLRPLFTTNFPPSNTTGNISSTKQTISVQLISTSNFQQMHITGTVITIKIRKKQQQINIEELTYSQSNILPSMYCKTESKLNKVSIPAECHTAMVVYGVLTPRQCPPISTVFIGTTTFLFLFVWKMSKKKLVELYFEEKELPFMDAAQIQLQLSQDRRGRRKKSIRILD